MSHKKPTFKFAEITSTSVIASILGIGAISILSRSLLFACFVGMLGILTGIVTLKMQVERLDKISAGLGIALSIVPLIYALLTIFK